MPNCTIHRGPGKPTPRRVSHLRQIPDETLFPTQNPSDAVGGHRRPVNQSPVHGKDGIPTGSRRLEPACLDRCRRLKPATTITYL